MNQNPIDRPSNQLILAIENEPPHLNPTENPSYVLSQITYLNLFEPLFTLGNTGDIAPLLIKSYSYNAEENFYSFQLKPNIYFHNGKRLTASNLKKSLDYLRKNPKHPHPEYYASIARIEVKNDLKIIIYLHHPDALFLYYLTRPTSVIIDPDSLLVGTGPYYYEYWQRSNAIYFKRNMHYWRENPSNITDVIYKIVQSAQTQLLYLRNKQIDIIPYFDKQAFLPILEKENAFAYRETNTDTKVLLVFNQKKPTLKKRENRQFLTDIIKELPLKEAGFFHSASDIFSHFSIFHKDAVLSNPYLKKNTAIKKPASFPDKLTLTVPPFGYAKNAAELIALALKQYDVQLHIEQLEWGEWLQRTYQDRDFDLTIIASMTLSNLSNYARENYYYAYKNEAFNEAIEEWKTNLDSTGLSQNFQKLQNILMQDYANIFLFQLPVLVLYQKEIKIDPLFNASYIFELRKVHK